ncbi:MAG: hypothetical protein JWO36_6150 [Myxococcales bacterium]|nr:hypothetical protein [Myxococcales bacterium]
MIPVIAIASMAIAATAGQLAIPALAIGALGAALCTAVRAFAGNSLAASIAAGAAALLGVLGLLDTSGFSVARAAFAGAAAIFAISELARLTPVKSPYPAIGAAVLAAILDPSFVGLTAIAGARFVVGPWPRPRWAAVAAPGLGVAAFVLAVIAALAHHGVLSTLWIAWTGGPPHPDAPSHVMLVIGDALGPLTAIAALSGLAVCASRGRTAAAAVLVIALGALAVALHDGKLVPAALVTAALAAGVGVGRLAATVRWPAGQTLVGATASFMLLVAPALGLIKR